MRQLSLDVRTGRLELLAVPAPQVREGALLIATRRSAVSAGTERMLVEFSKAGLLGKARRQPERVRQVLDKVRTDGLLPTLDAVRSKLAQPLPLGYASAGVVLEVGRGVETFSAGDRVVSNGPHAEIVRVPKNLCARIPDQVSDEEAAFTVIGAIGLQGVRLAQPTLGERFAVIGMGLIGLITAQLLQAHGCRVLGMDISPERLRLAEELGVETANASEGADPVAAGMGFSHGRGVDGVLLTAATSSSKPVHDAAQMCRKRGRIVLVGVTGLELSREDFYEKELSFQVSCSYGPGRYDPSYEEQGHDYPFGYVRWTEQRNFQAVLELMAAGKLNVKPLISHRFPFERALEAYDQLSSGSCLGVVLEYQHVPSSLEEKRLERTVCLQTQLQQPDRTVLSKERPVVGVIGAGEFTRRTLLPALGQTGARLKVIASSSGLSGSHLGKRFGFEQSTTDARGILSDDEVDAVFITTRHDTHARFAVDGLRSGKHVYVEKPLCLTEDELGKIVGAKMDSPSTLLMVGFNRRFAPPTQRMKELLDSRAAPLSAIVTVNAGVVPHDHWIQDSKAGGGRIIGEACHFIDLLRFLIGHTITGVEVVASRDPGNEGASADTASIRLSFSDGSFGTVHYFANGHRAFPKERVEVFGEGKVLALDNFRVLRGYGCPGFRRMVLRRQDKGHKQCIQAFVDAVRQGSASPIPFDELEEVARTTIRAAELARRSQGC